MILRNSFTTTILVSATIFLPACTTVQKTEPQPQPVQVTQPTTEAADKAAEFLAHKIKFNQFCFTGTALSACDFENPEAVRSLIGSYSISVFYYDADGTQVATARTTGRYAAIVEIKRADGSISRRYATLCRLAGDSMPATTKLITQPLLMKMAGIDDQILADRKAELAKPAVRPGASPALTEAANTIRIAGLMDLTRLKAAGKPVPKDTLLNLDWEWWVTFKRRLQGFDRRYPNAFVCPTTLEGAPATMVHAGSLEQAGIKPNTLTNIDEACKSWVIESGVPFGLCVVRHGVIVVNKGYGVVTMKSGEQEPFTAEMSAPLASASKFLGGLLLLEFADQGLIGLDDPVDKYVPAFLGSKVPVPVTIRHLYLHTSGFTNALSDIQQDAEEIAADVYPSVRVGSTHNYTTAGLAVGGKIMEMISGETIPQLFRNHLTAPLGATGLEVERTSGGGSATALELAKIGQMALNGGSYGKMRFFGPETLAKAMPIPGKDRWDPPDKTCRWGIGIKQYDIDGLSKSAFGHPGATGTCLVIDPKYDLVIAMTRFEEGSRFKDFLARKAIIYKAILDTIDAGK